MWEKVNSRESPILPEKNILQALDRKEGTVTLTFDLWPPNFNEFILHLTSSWKEMMWFSRKPCQSGRPTNILGKAELPFTCRSYMWVELNIKCVLIFSCLPVTSIPWSRENWNDASCSLRKNKTAPKHIISRLDGHMKQINIKSSGQSDDKASLPKQKYC